MTDHTIAIIEAEHSFRRALSALIETMGHSVEEYSDFHECSDSLDEQRVGCIIINTKGDGAEELEQILPWISDHPACQVILLTDGSSTQMVVRAIRGGVSNLLEHPFHFVELQTAVEQAIQEHTELLQSFGKRLAPEVARLLTPQEEDIARLMLEGASIKQMAAKLDVSIRTIHYRKNEIYKKIGVEDRDSAISALKFNNRSSQNAIHQY